MNTKNEDHTIREINKIDRFNKLYEKELELLQTKELLLLKNKIKIMKTMTLQEVVDEAINEENDKKYNELGNIMIKSKSVNKKENINVSYLVTDKQMNSLDLNIFDEI